MDLRHLTDKVLLNDTKRFVIRERELTTMILHHLREIGRRKLYSDVGCSSLFEYTVRELGYAEASAQRRIQAARLLEEMPEIEGQIESGALSLTNISQVQNFFKQNGVMDIEQKKFVLNEVKDLSKRACEKKLFEISGIKISAKESTKRISEDQNKVSIILSDETLKKLEYLKNLLGEAPSMDELINLMVDEAIKNKEKQKFKITDKPKSTPPAEAGRVISSAVKRAVFKRDKTCRKCGSSHLLQYDHIHPFALGGKSTIENVRLLCSNCNQRERIRAKLHGGGS